MANVSPCKGCERREVGCHSSCGDYVEWRKKRDEMLTKSYQDKESRRMTTKWILRNTKRKEQWK